jgi:maleamate amidohydrolase
MGNKNAWDSFMTERDKVVYREAQLGMTGGFGKRPALLVIDASYDFLGEHPAPLLESIKRWPLSSGEEGWNAVRNIRALRDAAHEKGVPVIYTTAFFRKDRWDAGGWAWKTGRGAEWPADSTRDRNAIVEEIAPHPQDIVIAKQKPSAFFGTNLASYLTLLMCDSVVVTGGTTSGCVRATVVDAFSLNYRVALPEEACFDRFQASHAVSLCDMNAKYADVTPVRKVLDFLGGLPPGLFDGLAAGAG